MTTVGGWYLTMESQAGHEESGAIKLDRWLVTMKSLSKNGASQLESSPVQLTLGGDEEDGATNKPDWPAEEVRRTRNKESTKMMRLPNW